MELLLSLIAMMVSLSLRPIDMYNPLQIFLNEAGSQDFGILVCDSIFSGADLSCFTAFILLKVPLTAVELSRKPVPPSPPWLRHDASVLIPRLSSWSD